MTLSAKTEFCVDMRELPYPPKKRIYPISEALDKRLRESVGRREDSIAGQVARAYMKHIKKIPGAKVELWFNLEAKPPHTHAFKSTAYGRFARKALSGPSGGRKCPSATIDIPVQDFT